MKKNVTLLVLLIAGLISFNGHAQDVKVSKTGKILENQKNEIINQEKEALKEEVKTINDRLKSKLITNEEATNLREDVARKRALNIENRIAILENQLEIFERNKTDSINFDDKYSMGYSWNESFSWFKNKMSKSINSGVTTNSQRIKYDRRTYTSFIFADGLNYVSTNGSLSNFKKSNFSSAIFFELGWQWRTRVFKKTNFLRFNYGFSFQWNPIELRNNERFVLKDGKAVLEEFQFQLQKSTFKRTNLVIPLYIEFGPTKVSKSENRIRYSIRNQLRFGLGGYVGVNLNSKQKLGYFENGVSTILKQKNKFNTKQEIYGLSAYAGLGSVQFYVKYDLSPIFKDTSEKLRNFSIGLRTDL